MHSAKTWDSSTSINDRRVVIYKAFCLDVAQGRTNGGPYETRTHSCSFESYEIPIVVFLNIFFDKTSEKH